MRLASALFLVFSASVPVTAAQGRSLAVQVDHPIPVGDNFIGSYDGVFGLGLTFSEPVGRGFLVRPSLDYQLLKLTSSVSAHLATVRAGVGYEFRLGGSVAVVPEAGVEFARVQFDAPPDPFGDDLRDSSVGGDNATSLYVGVVPGYDSGGVRVVAPVGFRALFFQEPGDAPDVAFNTRGTVLTVGLGAAFDL